MLYRWYGGIVVRQERMARCVPMFEVILGKLLKELLAQNRQAMVNDIFDRWPTFSDFSITISDAMHHPHIFAASTNKAWLIYFRWPPLLHARDASNNLTHWRVSLEHCPARKAMTCKNYNYHA
mmetsp:Transcript_13829/g.22033  ORF Transcript_13829/g.22033 Transcript_13829/m.22033 type:complete len:123 (+) Transcript_13829:666-1034(+)